MLEAIIEDAVELIEADSREEGDVYPPMAHTVVKRLLRSYNFTSPLIRERLYNEASRYETEHGVFDDAQRFICTSLPDIIGEFVKHRMGDKYRHLFDARMAPWAGASAE